jgi:hypothetical protein
MKTICTLSGLLLLAFAALDLRAEEPPQHPSPASTPDHPPQTPSPANPPAPAPVPAQEGGKGQSVPNQRELSEQQYTWLGRIVWERMQVVADAQKRDLGEEDIRDLVDRMRRNRDEVNLTLDELQQLVSAPVLCPNGVPQPPPAPGVDLEKAGNFLHRLFK